MEDLFNFDILGLAGRHVLALQIPVDVKFTGVSSATKFREMPPTIVYFTVGVYENHAGSTVETVDKLKRTNLK